MKKSGALTLTYQCASTFQYFVQGSQQFSPRLWLKSVMLLQFIQQVFAPKLAGETVQCNMAAIMSFREVIFLATYDVVLVRCTLRTKFCDLKSSEDQSRFHVYWNFHYLVLRITWMSNIQWKRNACAYLTLHKYFDFVRNMHLYCRIVLPVTRKVAIIVFSWEITTRHLEHLKLCEISSKYIRRNEANTPFSSCGWVQYSFLLI